MKIVKGNFSKLLTSEALKLLLLSFLLRQKTRVGKRSPKKAVTEKQRANLELLHDENAGAAATPKTLRPIVLQLVLCDD